MARTKYSEIKTQKYIEDYYNNPNYCKHCGKIIFLDINQKTHNIKKKKFCNRTCAAIFNNSKFPKRIKKEKSRKEKIDIVGIRTKGEMLSLRKTWQGYRSAIAKHARKIFKESDKDKKCFTCGYDKHYDVAHIKPVSDFSENVLILKINDINNLIALCPNCHWEYDNGLIELV